MVHGHESRRKSKKKKESKWKAKAVKRKLFLEFKKRNGEGVRSKEDDVDIYLDFLG